MTTLVCKVKVAWRTSKTIRSCNICGWIRGFPTFNTSRISVHNCRATRWTYTKPCSILIKSRLTIDTSYNIARCTVWRTEDTTKIISCEVGSRNTIETCRNTSKILTINTIIKQTWTRSTNLTCWIHTKANIASTCSIYDIISINTNST